MIKYLSTAAIVVTLLTGCGGSDNDKKSSSSASSTPASSAPASSTPASSTPASSEAASSVPASSMAASSMPASSAASSVASVSADLSFGFAEGILGWYVNGGGTNINLEHDASALALRIQPVAWSDPAPENWKREARTDLGSAIDFTGATVTAVVSVPASYKTDEGLVLQIVLQGATGGVYSWNPVTGLVAGDNTIVVNVAPEIPANATGITSIGVMLGTPPKDLTILDPILVKSIEVNFPDASSSSSSVASSTSSSTASSASNVLTIPMSSTWRGHEGGAVAYTTDGVVMTTTAADQGAVYDYAGPVNFVGATISFVINVSSEFKASGAALQPFAQEKTTWKGYFTGCWLNNADMTAGVDQTVSCGPMTGIPEFDLQAGQEIQVGFMAKSAVPAGTVTIKTATVTLAP